MKTIDYKLLSELLVKAGEAIEEAKSECSKEYPDEVNICDCAVERLGSLFYQIESCTLSRDFRTMQSNTTTLTEVDIAL